MRLHARTTRLFLALMSAAITAGGQAAVQPFTAADAETLSSGDQISPTGHRQAARLRLLTPRVQQAAVHHDEFALVANQAMRWDELPAMEFDLVSDGERLLVLSGGLVDSTHPLWEYSVASGRIVNARGEEHGGHALVPFTLHERNANCVHYGLLEFDFGGSDPRIEVVYRVDGETCQYFKFDSWGSWIADYEPVASTTAAAWGEAAAAEHRAALPVQPIAALGEMFPDADFAQFGSASAVDPADMTVYGFVADGTHFQGGCQTRSGRHPFCETLPLPSYSLAKSLFAGLAVMRAEKLFPGIVQTRIGTAVDACRDDLAWQDVTIAHALDMATGHYRSAEWMVDEDAAILDAFFVAEDHATKVMTACRTYPRRAPPGTHWVYHTSDTYLAGTGLRAALKARLGRDVDLYQELVWQPIFERLGLSNLARNARRTNDAEAQPFFGWGLYFHADDIARLALFLGPQRGLIAGEPVVDEAMFSAAMQRDPLDRGLPADMDGMLYKNGFRALDVSAYFECREPTWVIVLAGFGGIVVALFPNDTAYYHFSDGGSHRWLPAAREAHRIRPFCS
jgi:hypothetical protein